VTSGSDPDVIDHLAAAVRIPSLTGDEKPVLELLAERGEALGLRAQLREYDLEAVRAHPDWPGAEAPREELWGLTLTRGGKGPRLALCGHVDVVDAGNEQWRRDPFSGEIDGGRVHGRGSVDMKAGVVAAMHGLAGAAPGREVVLHCVSSEEDGGQGCFAELERDSEYAGCLITEPTGFQAVCAQGGSLTVIGTVNGRAAHAAERLHGRSAIDAYLPVHEALADHERALNAEIEDELMRELELPYPLVVGTLQAGEWASTVPDRLTFSCRLPVRVGESFEDALAGMRRAVGPDLELRVDGGRFHAARTDQDGKLARLVRDAAGGGFAGVPWGADMRLWTAKGIPTVMCGTHGIERAHAVDEYVEIADVERLAGVVRQVVERL
jgi:acetylornithine deacetylase